MFRLEHEIIVPVGGEQLRDGLSLDAIFEAMLNLDAEIRLPAAEIVVDVDHHRDSGLIGLGFQGQDVHTIGERESGEARRLRETRDR